MHGFRRTSVFVLSVAVLSICACATSVKKSSEDFQIDGFTICICDDVEGATGPTVTVTDAESAERLAQWFRHRPRGSVDWDTENFQQVFPNLFSTTIRIETTRLRVNLPLLPVSPVVSETRATPSDDWSKTSWIARKEDRELTLWLIERFKTSLIAEYEDEAATDAFGSGQTIPN